MKSLFAAILAASAVALAPVANAETPPPVAPGEYTFYMRDGFDYITITHDCGPDCFAFASKDGSPPWNFRLQPDGTWFEAGSGVGTRDGITFINRHGLTATLARN